MSDTESNFFSDELSKAERKRLDRQLRLPGWDQSTLKNASVLIVGIGGLGTEIAKNLAMTGVGTLHLVDLDIIEHSNLNRQILFSQADEGDAKAKVAAKNLMKINPHSRYIWHNKALEDLDPKIYEDVDVIIAGLDSVEARKELIRRAVHNQKPMIDGGTATYYGHVYVYLPNHNACLECDPLRENERDDLAACTLVGIPRKLNHCLFKGQLHFEDKMNRSPDTDNQKEMQIIINYANTLVKKHFRGQKQFTIDDAVQLVDHHEPTIITINAVIASLQSQEALKVIHHQKGRKLGQINDEYTIYNGLTGRFFYIKKARNPKCSLCGYNATKIEKFEIPGSMTFDMLLHLIKKKGYSYDEEFPPMVYRIDTQDMHPVKHNQTLKEVGIRNGETLFLGDLTKQGRELDLYVKLYLKI